MNLKLADVEMIIKKIDDLDPQWRETFIDLAQDWLEMNRKPIEGRVIGKALAMGGSAVAQLDAIESILKMPLCDPCRQIVGGDHFSKH